MAARKVCWSPIYHDQVNQLVGATKNVSTATDETFTYDNLGNRLKKNNQTTNNVYDNNNRIVEDDKFTYSHDDNGNMIKKVNKATGYTYKYVWDYENRLQFVTEHATEGAQATKTHTYMYDALGRRIFKDSNGVTRKYIYDGEDILLEFDNDDQLQAKFTHGPGIDEPVEMSRDGNVYFYHTDGLGSITGLTDANGNVVQSYSYSSFGGTTVYNSSGIEIAPEQMIQNPYGYTGREWDYESLQYFYRTRYYNPGIGRFMSEDSIGLAGDLNLYRYVNNQSTKYADPDGKITVGVIFGITNFIVSIETARVVYFLTNEMLALETQIEQVRARRNNLLQRLDHERYCAGYENKNRDKIAREINALNFQEKILRDIYRDTKNDRDRLVFTQALPNIGQLNPLEEYIMGFF